MLILAVGGEYSSAGINRMGHPILNVFSVYHSNNNFKIIPGKNIFRKKIEHADLENLNRTSGNENYSY